RRAKARPRAQEHRGWGRTITGGRCPCAHPAPRMRKGEADAHGLEERTGKKRQGNEEEGEAKEGRERKKEGRKGEEGKEEQSEGLHTHRAPQRRTAHPRIVSPRPRSTRSPSAAPKSSPVHIPAPENTTRHTYPSPRSAVHPGLAASHPHPPPAFAPVSTTHPPSERAAPLAAHCAPPPLVLPISPRPRYRCTLLAAPYARAGARRAQRRADASPRTTSAQHPPRAALCRITDASSLRPTQRANVRLPRRANSPRARSTPYLAAIAGGAMLRHRGGGGSGRCALWTHERRGVRRGRAGRETDSRAGMWKEGRDEGKEGR
ncbi:hypothetical protein DFH09DRAFT_1440333, partial [Mycena vulgaris]